MGRDAGWFPAALVGVVALVAPARSSLAQAPAPERSASEKPPAPRVLLIAGEEGDTDDAEIMASELARLLADRHGMKTTQVRAHSKEIGHALDALPDTDVAILLVRSRTWLEAERRRLEEWVAKGGKLVEMFAPPDPIPSNQGVREVWVVGSEPFHRTESAGGGRIWSTSIFENMRLKKVLEQPSFLRQFVFGVYWVLGKETPVTVDVILPETTPLTEFDVSTAYVSDWSKPVASQVFPPEEGIGGFNDVQWIHVRSFDGELDLRRFDPNSKQGTIYVKSTLTVKGKRDLELVLQSDDGLEVFVDGKKRATRQEVRTLHSGCDLVPLSLEEGEHELLLKVMNAADAWAVRARVRDLTAYRAEKPK